MERYHYQLDWNRHRVEDCYSGMVAQACLSCSTEELVPRVSQLQADLKAELDAINAAEELANVSVELRIYPTYSLCDIDPHIVEIEQFLKKYCMALGQFYGIHLQ